jgi:DNA primase large subunit
MNYLPNYDNLKLDRLVNRAQAKKALGRESLAITKTINKSLLPMLHNKTYFKSVTTLFAELPKNWKEGSVYEKQAT